MKTIYSLKEFAAIVRGIAKGKYFTVSVEYTEHSDGENKHSFRAYVGGLNTGFSGPTMEEAIGQLREAASPSPPPNIDVELDNDPDDIKILHEKEPLLD